MKIQPRVLLLLIVIIILSGIMLWVVKFQELNAVKPVTSDRPWDPMRVCIDSVWNESTAITFILRNCGTVGISAEDFAKMKYYVDDIEAACTPDVMASFNRSDFRTVTCPAGSYGTCAAGKCPKRTIKITTVYGKSDIVGYQYASG